ncbi:hypothetical protein, partial [Pseudomonas aeruginosa]|uniref:hypothetical protein n=2 Tax=Pseudomonas aeruginosa TaxID=287 RepID=UPI001F167FC4
ALQARSARTASASRVTICRLHSRRRNRNPSRCGHDPQGGARPAVGNQRSMAADNAAAWPRDAEIPLTDVRSVPKTGLARPPPTQQTARKGRLNFLYAVLRRTDMEPLIAERVAWYFAHPALTEDI